ncbi:hypothetical protein SOVF_147400 [Spinacia oleracea]|nr:hypothetical protein SOVF_147400 [Spinacia oleracea]
MSAIPAIVLLPIRLSLWKQRKQELKEFDTENLKREKDDNGGERLKNG